MHHIHRTKAFVIKGIPFSEADKQLLLLTQDLGLVRAVAQGSRKKESKMRQSIQDYSLVDAALVSGKTGWRLVNVAFIQNFYQEIGNEELRMLLCRVFSLVNRLVVGESPDPDLFNLINGFVDFSIQKEELITIEMIKSLESILTARILYALGYLNSELFHKYIEEELSIELIEQLKDDDLEKVMIKEINRALKDSSL